MFGSSQTLAIGFISAAGANESTISILFFINLALGLCAIIELTAFAVLLKKTLYVFIAGIITVTLFGLSVVVFIVQLIIYAMGNTGAEYAVYIGLAVLSAAFVAGMVYSILLARLSRPKLCISTGVCQLVPPVGTVLAVVLSYRIKHDTRVQKLVFNGYALTYATLNAFCEKNKAELIDGADNERLEKLRDNEIKLKLKELKEDAKSGDAKKLYDYAAALLGYSPSDSSKAIKYMTKAAELNYMPAMFNLGYCYETGEYIKPDYKTARRYYAKAAVNGDTDAELRLGILSIKEGKAQEGLSIFRLRAENNNDVAALFNVGVCYERGFGVNKDIKKALDIYAQCCNAGLFAAQKRMFSIASKSINSAQNGQFFRKATDREFTGTFALMINGLIQIKRRLAADASECFLDAVKQGGDWEGVARCLVGTLYIDCGATEKDRHNGMEFVKSAFSKFPGARDVYAAISQSMIKEDPEV